MQMSKKGRIGVNYKNSIGRKMKTIKCRDVKFSTLIRFIYFFLYINCYTNMIENTLDYLCSQEAIFQK